MSITKRDNSLQLHGSHLFQIGQLIKLTKHKATRVEAERELLRYRDQGLIIQKFGKEKKVAKKSRAHEDTPKTFSGQGIIYAVIDDRDDLREGNPSTIDVIADGIEQALDAGHEDSESIARFLTTSAFQHIPDKRVRFNSVLKAGDAVGAMILRKLYNAYNELAELAQEEDDPAKKKVLLAEAQGFAEAVTVVMSPFSCEYEEDPRLVNWDEVDRISAAFEKEQRLVRRERKGNPQ